MESTIGLFKTELIKPRRPWKTLSDVELATAEWVDWYNHHRLHGENLTPHLVKARGEAPGKDGLGSYQVNGYAKIPARARRPGGSGA